jgi:hypothetical protein
MAKKDKKPKKDKGASSPKPKPGSSEPRPLLSKPPKR